MIKVQCPYCLEPMQVKSIVSSVKCANPDCLSFIDKEYFETKSDRITRIGFLGGPGHGKTTYLTSLFLCLNALNKHLDGFTWRPLDDHSHRQIHYQVPLFEYGILPEATEPDFKKPALISCSKLPYFDNQLIVSYDVAGENWEDLENINEVTKLVANCNAIWLKLSIPDSIPNLENQINSMLHGYIQKVNALEGIDLKKQHLIVVLTKAELLGKAAQHGVKPLPHLLQEWLKEGSYKNYLNFKESTLVSIKTISKEIEKWLQENNCGGFIDLAHEEFKSVEYTLVSATGSETLAVHKDITDLIQRLGLTFRVTEESLDPLIDKIPQLLLDRMKEIVGQNASFLSLEKKINKIFKDKDIKKLLGSRVDEYQSYIMKNIYLGEASQILMSKITPDDPKRVLDPLFLTLEKEKHTLMKFKDIIDKPKHEKPKGLFGLFSKK